MQNIMLRRRAGTDAPYLHHRQHRDAPQAHRCIQRLSVTGLSWSSRQPCLLLSRLASLRGDEGNQAAYFMHGTPGEDTGPTNTEAGAIVGRVPSRGVMSRIQAQDELSGLARIFHGAIDFRNLEGKIFLRRGGMGVGGLVVG